MSLGAVSFISAFFSTLGVIAAICCVVVCIALTGVIVGAIMNKRRTLKVRRRYEDE